MAIIRPQKGYQMMALSSPADILIGGGAAGVGKTFTLLLEFLRHINVNNFGGVIFRRTMPQVANEGGLWDASNKLYNLVDNAYPRSNKYEWKFGDRSKLKFSGLQYEKDIYDYQGSEIPFIGFDELTHFSKKMFFYMLTRNRSTCGVKPYIRATCNPDPDSWVADFIKWWIAPDGFPDPERQGKLRYFMQGEGEYIWGDSKKEVIEKGWHLIQDAVEKSGIKPEEFIKSLTFVGGSIYDNKALLDIDPAYLANLNAQDEETKAQLLQGNWNIKISDNDIYDYYEFQNIFTNEALVNISDKKYITADIALKGSDKMIILVWKGHCIIDVVISDKNDGKQAVDMINQMKNKHTVMNSCICYDNDGVGGGISGFISGAVEFHNNGKVIDGRNYDNLKAQCIYETGSHLSDYYITEEVANRMYDDKTTIKQQFLKERKAIKRAKKDHEAKLKVIPKAEQKVFLGGKSPDLLDAFMMRRRFDLRKRSITI